MALAGYQLAHKAIEHVNEPDTLAVLVDPPSVVLGWLKQAEAAHRRCKGVLPKLWTYKLDKAWAIASNVKPWLEQLQQEGDRWRPASLWVRG